MVSFATIVMMHMCPGTELISIVWTLCHPDSFLLCLLCLLYLYITNINIASPHIRLKEKLKLVKQFMDYA